MQIQRLSVLGFPSQSVSRLRSAPTSRTDGFSLRFGQGQPLLPAPEDPAVGELEKTLALAHRGDPQAVTGLIQKIRANPQLLGPLSLKSGRSYLLHQVIRDTEIPSDMKATMVEGLIEAGADPNQRVMLGDTGELTDHNALSLALIQNEAPVLAVLKKCNAFLPDIGYAYYSSHPEHCPYNIRQWLEEKFRANRELVERLALSEPEEVLHHWVQDSINDGAQPAGWAWIGGRLTPYLHLAYPYLSLLELMRQKGASLETSAGDGNRLLHVAIEDDNMRVFLWLLEQGVEVNAPNSYGMTPLYLAVAGNHLSMVRQLLLRTISVNAPDVEGNTPLHMATTANAVRLLVEAGADLQQKNRAEETPLLMALRTQKPLEVIKALLEQGASMDEAENMPPRGGSLRFYREKYADKDGLSALWNKTAVRRLLGETFLARLEKIFKGEISLDLDS